MTACVNRKHTKKVAAVVTASLVGALSLGVAPVAAMATNEGISTQSVSPATSWQEGTCTYAKDNDGYIITNPEGYEFEYDGRAHHILPQIVQPKDGKAVAIDDSKVTFDYLDGNGDWKPVKKEQIVPAGTYRAVVPARAILNSSAKYSGNLYVEFSIVGKSLQGSTIFDASSEGTADTTFTYTGKSQEIGFVVNGHRYDFDGAKYVNNNGEDNFTVEWWNTNTNEKLPAGTIPTDAGNYTAVLVGIRDYTGSETKINFTIGQLDLSTADVVISDMPNYSASLGMGLPYVAYVNGVPMYTADAGTGISPINLTISWAGEEPGIIRDNGTYQMTVAAINGNKNVTGSKTVNFKVVDKVISASDFEYKGAPLNGTIVEVTRTVTPTYFDYRQISCTDAAAMKQAIVTITDAEGNTVKPEDVNSKAGVYTLTIGFAADNYAYGLDAPVSMTIKVMNDDLWTNADLTYTWNGDVVEGAIHPTFDGEAVLPEIDTIVKSSNGTDLVEGTDYDVVVTDANGNEVDQIVDAGVYFVNVVSDTYNILQGDLSGTQLVVNVQPLQLPNLQIGSDQLKDFGANGSFIPFGGTDASYYFYYVDAKGNEVRLPEGVIEVDHFNFDDDFTDLSAIGHWWEFWTISWDDVDWSDVDAINAVGQYVPSVKVVNDNYMYVPDITTTNGRNVQKIDVRDSKVFSDVKSTDWGAEEIFKANDLGYMRGYNGTTIFGKDDSIKRGDVCEVLYKMAGSPEWSNEGQTNGEYVTGFDDVREDMYYAKSIAWAVSCGIVSGDAGTANFRPEDSVSRQELAKMLAEYAKLTGDDISADTSVLDGYKDADEVSEWAEEYVAWAVENDIMGVGTDELWATGNITRRQVAIMTVRFQPDGPLADSMVPPTVDNADSDR